jgi:hypothetical protein
MHPREHDTPPPSPGNQMVGPGVGDGFPGLRPPGLESTRFPLVDHRDIYTLIRHYVFSVIHTGEQSLVPILRFRGGQVQ